LGKDIELQHILNHKVCNAAFGDFLKKRMAVENLLFLNAVTKFEEILAQIQKEIWKVLGMRGLKFFQVVSADNYSFFDELIITTAVKKGGGGGGTAPSSSGDLAAVGEGKLDGNEGESGRKLSVTSNTSKNPTVPGQHGMLRISLGNVRATSFKELNNEMDKITQAIQSGMENATNSGSATNSPSMVGVNTTPDGGKPHHHHQKGFNPDDGLGITSDEENDNDNDDKSFRSYEVSSDQWMVNGSYDTMDNHRKGGNNGNGNPEHWSQARSAKRGSSGGGGGSGISSKNKPPLAIKNPSRPTSGINLSSLNPLADGSSSPFRDVPDRDIATLFQNYNQKFVQNIHELKEVAKSIVEKHIVVGCEFEVNIQQSMKKLTMDKLENINKNSVGKCLHELYNSVYEFHVNLRQKYTNLNHDESVAGLMPPLEAQTPHVRFAAAEKEENSATRGQIAQQSQKSNEPLPGMIDLEQNFTLLFAPVKNEIYNLLNNDLFRRWKHTPEFETLMKQFEPYDSQELHKSKSLYFTSPRLPLIGGGGGGSGQTTQSSNNISEQPSTDTILAAEEKRHKPINRSSSKLSFYVTSSTNSRPSNGAENIPEQPSPDGNNNTISAQGKKGVFQARNINIKNNTVAIEG
jgi:hypothetical protein